MMAMLSGRRFDLPLESTAASRMLPWLVTALVYLAVLALAVMAVADTALQRFDMRARLVTVTLPEMEHWGPDQRALDAALDLLRQTQGVTSATVVTADELKKLIEPWLSDDGDHELPLPRLIDVTLDPAAKPDLVALQDELQEVVPNATVGVEAMSRDRAERLAAFFRAWSGAAGVLLLISALALVAVTTKMSLDMHSQTVELLRLMGAADEYVARQFERHALLHGLRGGLLGFALAVVTILALLYTSRRMELAGSMQLGLRLFDWLLLACVPVVSVLLITSVARMTALWRLGRMT